MTKQYLHLFIGGAACCILGCGGDRTPVVDLGGSGGSSASRGLLIDHRLWSVVDSASDPLVPHRPLVVICGDLTSWGSEGDHLEVDTGRCNYLMLAQPALVAAKVGDHVLGEFSHFDLTAPEPATGHIAILVGDRLIVERSIAIPGAADVFMLDEIVTAPFEKGTLVYLHVHNHGQNNWRIFDLSVSSPPR